MCAPPQPNFKFFWAFNSYSSIWAIEINHLTSTPFKYHHFTFVYINFNLHLLCTLSHIHTSFCRPFISSNQNSIICKQNCINCHVHTFSLQHYQLLLSSRNAPFIKKYKLNSHRIITPIYIPKLSLLSLFTLIAFASLWRMFTPFNILTPTSYIFNTSNIAVHKSASIKFHIEEKKSIFLAKSLPCYKLVSYFSYDPNIFVIKIDIWICSYLNTEIFFYYWDMKFVGDNLTWPVPNIFLVSYVEMSVF